MVCLSLWHSARQLCLSFVPGLLIHALITRNSWYILCIASCTCTSSVGLLLESLSATVSQPLRMNMLHLPSPHLGRLPKCLRLVGLWNQKNQKVFLQPSRYSLTGSRLSRRCLSFHSWLVLTTRRAEARSSHAWGRLGRLLSVFRRYLLALT